jgi:hypothetical protein
MWGKGIADAMASLFIVTIIISAIVGWGLIEGLIWIFSHISISFV